MTYPKKEYSNSAIDRAGAILINSKSTHKNIEEALNVLENWRACHGYPMNTFNATLRTRLQMLKLKAIVAQRLKRRPSIVEKLKRFKDMKLSRMQDIGGLRAVVKSVSEVHNVRDKYLSDTQFQHRLVREDDYIEKPKSDGYRSIHLVYKYKNRLRPEYDGLQLELQIRTKLQHIWATAVETMGSYLGQKLKAGEGEKKWRDFFAITSSAFAFLENTPRVPNYSHLGKEQTFKAVRNIEKNIEALKWMEGFNLGLKMTQERKGKSSYYHLIVLDSTKMMVSVLSYAKKDIEIASKDYAKFEASAVKNPSIQPVLVSAGDLTSIKNAYPNYFLDVKDFISRVQKITQ